MLFNKIITRIPAVLLMLLCLVGANNIYAQDNSRGDSIVVSIAPDYDKVGKFHRFIFGEGYRKLWAAPVKLKVFHLATEKGGMTILKMGGGLQTKSLRLRDKSGNEWVLRTIQKYPERGLPPNLRAGLARDILQDQVITGHPYSSLTVPPLAEVLGIPHAHPEIVYVPEDPLLGEFQKEFGNAVFLLEEREPLDEGGTDNTEKVQRELQKDNDTRLEQKIVLRARLLDIILGDWDRHEDQWRWAKEGGKDDKVYTPIPRDRDKVYYNTSGVFPWVVSHQWLKSNIQGFHPGIRDVNGYNFNNRYFDRYFLNQLDEQAWKEQIAFVKDKLTDSLIGASIKLLPDTIFSLSGKWLIQTIIARRDGVDKPAMEYYRFLSNCVDIPASNKDEYFEILDNDAGALTVKINKIKKDETKGHLVYQRSFDPAVTKEIRLYGFDGNDVFAVNTNRSSPIKVRLVGGKGQDSFNIGQQFSGRQKIFIYDGKSEKNNFSSTTGIKMRLSDDSDIHVFNKKAFKYDRLTSIILANFSLDDGLLLIGGFSNEKHGFRKEPYAFFNELLVNYSLNRKSFLITWFAEFKKAIGKNDLGINLFSRGPHSVNNFFGLGNEPVFENKGSRKIKYYRSRYDYVNLDVRLYRNVTPHWRLSAGVAGQYYTSKKSNNKEHFFDKYNNDYPSSLLYKDKGYAGLIAGAELDTRNSLILPSQGLYWNTTIKGMREIGGENKSYGNLLSEFSFYLAPFKTQNFVIANRVGGGTTIGEPAFFQQMYLGGKQSLRGFHTNRFAGKTVLYNNLEMRLKLFDFNSYLLPGAVGLIAFNDVGRVWLPGETSTKWHDGYGTGIYVIPAQLLLIQGVIGFSAEGALPYISVGFRF
ncbi:MAG: BamA/TamA family outer membrane protein [Ferruginibacter sp.]